MAGVLSVVLAAVVAIEPDLCESVGPVPVIDPYVVSFTNGVIVRDGQARFWAGNGCDLGSAQATPVGLWLAKVHGVTLTSHEPGTSFDLKEKGTNAEIRVNFKPGAQSWIREAIRLGMLTEMPNGGGQYFRSPLKKYSDAHPDFHEICYQAGHGVQFETLDPLGSRLLMHFRQPTLDYLKDEPHFIFELNREPAQYPANGLARAGFRSWARLKYADLAVANAVWGTSFASWEMVELPAHEY